MRVLLQRVSAASVEVNSKVIGSIARGFVVFVGFHHNDGDEKIQYMIDKIVNLRVFEDQDGKFNLSLHDVHFEILIVSQFTLYADCSKGRRPSFASCASPEQAEVLYNKFVQQCQSSGFKIQTGQFQSHMMVHLVNDGPVTIMLEK